MSEPKISVIVPVYKVEPYLRKCLDSITGQTYQNLEIILVDDGSPDSCGSICDDYAAQDKRVRVIHKENGGVSSARNAGLAAATGDWIGWVDSDDWIESDMYNCMLKKAVEYGADIVVCGRSEHCQGRDVVCGWGKEQVLDTQAALELLLKNDIMQSYLWDKLWRRELFDGQIFPTGRTFEDITVMHRLFMRAQRVVCLPEVKYHYLHHQGSIVDNKSLGNLMNYFCATRLRLDELCNQWPQFQQLLETQCAVAAIGIWAGYYSNPKEERMRYRNKLKNIAVFSQNHYKEALQHMKLGFTGRIILCLTPHATWWAFSLAAVCGWLYKKKHGRVL